MTYFFENYMTVNYFSHNKLFIIFYLIKIEGAEIVGPRVRLVFEIFYGPQVFFCSPYRKDPVLHFWNCSVSK